MPARAPSAGKRFLRIKLLDIDGKPLKQGVNYTLTLEGGGGPSGQQSVAADGIIEHEVPDTKQKATLVVEYPQTDGTTHDWEMEVLIKGLEEGDQEIEEASGWTARLGNLGYDVGQGDAARAERALMAFQRDHLDKDANGVPKELGLAAGDKLGAETLKKLREIHGC